MNTDEDKPFPRAKVRAGPESMSITFMRGGFKISVIFCNSEVDSLVEAIAAARALNDTYHDVEWDRENEPSN